MVQKIKSGGMWIQKNFFSFIILALFGAYSALYLQQNTVIAETRKEGKEMNRIQDERINYKNDKVILAVKEHCEYADKALDKKVDNKTLQIMIQAIEKRQIKSDENIEKMTDNLHKVNENIVLLNEQIKNIGAVK